MVTTLCLQSKIKILHRSTCKADLKVISVLCPICTQNSSAAKAARAALCNSWKELKRK